MDVNGDMPAYPTNELQGSAGDYAMVSVGGLTKREAFAMAALAVLGSGHPLAPTDCREVASYAVSVADALLAELAKETP